MASDRRRDLLLVAAGGLLGTPARYGVEELLPHEPFPVGTFVVNVLGAFLLGVLLEGVGSRRSLRLLLGTGFLGAFTTASTLAVETDLLATAGRWPAAVAYALGSTVAGVAAATVGVLVAGRRARRLPADPDAP